MGTKGLTMFCINCRTQLPDEAKFCSNCGKPTHGTSSGSGSSTQAEPEVTTLPQQERTNQPATGTSVVVEPGSLEGAVREAQAGDVLRLKAGEYRLSHPLEIDKPLSLVGEGSGNTRVLCDGEEYVVKLVGDGPFRVHDLSFEHEGSLWAEVVEVACSVIDIRGCSFIGGVLDKTATYLPWLEGGKGGGRGLSLRNRTRGLVANCESVQNDGYGILVVDQAQPTLEGNSCQENKQSGIGYSGSAAGTARQNTCSANEWHGIRVQDQAHPTLEANTCQANQASGIVIFDQAQPTLEANTCQENGQFGIAYLGDVAVVARQNVCIRNTQDILGGPSPTDPRILQ